jgi:TPR repeat protein
VPRVLAGEPVIGKGIRFASPQAALEQGLGAYRAGFYHLALPGLQYAADSGLFFGRYYLAQLYADSAAPMTNHGRAYQLYQGIVEQYSATIDVDDDERAPYVGRALTAVAGYIYRGLPEIALEPSAERAAQFYQEAATFFRDRDAQFELAKLYLKGDGVAEDRRTALQWLYGLTQVGHSGAQAFLADLQWRGKFVKLDPPSAFALITVAVENAPPHERIWIEEIYQNIYCNVSPGARQEAKPLIASYRRLYAPRGGTREDKSSDFGLTPARVCANGEPLPDLSIKEGRASNDGGKVLRNAAPNIPPAARSGVMDVREKGPDSK